MKYRLKKDFIIPAGTEFENIDGTKREFINGNYESLIGTSKDSTAYFSINEDVVTDNKEYFEEV